MTGRDVGGRQDLVARLVETELADELLQDFAPRALRHRLADVVAVHVEEQAVAEQGVGVGRHIGEMRLIGHDDRHQPL